MWGKKKTEPAEQTILPRLDSIYVATENPSMLAMQLGRATGVAPRIDSTMSSMTVGEGGPSITFDPAWEANNGSVVLWFTVADPVESIRYFLALGWTPVNEINQNSHHVAGSVRSPEGVIFGFSAPIDI